MTEEEPEPNNPLGPYYPSEAPRIPGHGQSWLALLVATILILTAVAGLLELLSAGL